jgi:glutamate-5-semialdehyde dehydrogenase
MAFYDCIKNGLINAGLDQNSVQLIEITDREAVIELVKASDYVDAIIPRGGKGLIKNVSNHARVPVIKHLDGVCHTYLDEDADPQKGIDIAFNGKTRRYGVCNATETLLVHKNFDSKALDQLIKLYFDKGVELRGCEVSQKLSNNILGATEEDWSEEYLAPILSIKMVNSVDEAISHIEKYGSSHTDAIVTETKLIQINSWQKSTLLLLWLMPQRVLLMVLNMDLVQKLGLVLENFMSEALLVLKD